MTVSRCGVAFCAQAIALLLTVGLGACGKGNSEDVVARVGGRHITKKQFMHQLSIERASGDLSQGTSLRKRAMESLISAEWIRAQASRLGVSVGEAETERQLSFLDYVGSAGFNSSVLLPREAELRRSLSASGLSHEDRLSLVELNLLDAEVERKSHLLAERKLTYAQLVKYFQQHWRRFVISEEREFMILQNGSKQTVVRAKREIEAGREFLSVARRVSIDQEAPDGVQHLKRGEEEPEFVAHIFAAKLHELVGPVRQGVDYYIFKLIKITPPRRRTFAEVEKTIRRLLVDEKFEQAPAEPAEARASTWKPRTSCDVGYVVPLCGRRVGAK